MSIACSDSAMADNPVLAALGRPFRLGVAGGAPPSMIGPVHRLAATMDGRFAIAAAALSSRPERSRQESRAIGLAEDRCYGSVEEMLTRERERADGIEALAIITPNDSHARYLRMALASGLDAMVEKPLCAAFDEALALRSEALSAKRDVVLMHTYSGYPMVREMRSRVAAGEIGAVRFVEAEYYAGGLATLVEGKPGAEQSWRLKPERSGPSLVLGDIGTHAHHLVRFVTRAALTALSADVATLLPRRQVHDFAQARFRLDSGARGRLDVSNAAAGMSNHILLRVHGEEGYLEWMHRRHGELTLVSLDGNRRIIEKAHPNTSDAANRATRLFRPGHPEGLQEAVANLYAGLADRMLARRGHADSGLGTLAPDIDEGCAGVAFVDACLESSGRGGVSVTLPHW
jgi:predicted dehydrogenase